MLLIHFRVSLLLSPASISIHVDLYTRVAVQRASNSAGGQSVVVVLGLWPRKSPMEIFTEQPELREISVLSGLSFSTSHLLDSQVYDSSGSTVFVFPIKGKFTTTAIYLLLLIHVHPLSSNEAKIRYTGEGVK